MLSSPIRCIKHGVCGKSSISLKAQWISVSLLFWLFQNVCDHKLMSIGSIWVWSRKIRRKWIKFTKGISRCMLQTVLFRFKTRRRFSRHQTHPFFAPRKILFDANLPKVFYVKRWIVLITFVRRSISFRCLIFGKFLENLVHRIQNFAPSIWQRWCLVYTWILNFKFPRRTSAFVASRCSDYENKSTVWRSMGNAYDD